MTLDRRRSLVRAVPSTPEKPEGLRPSATIGPQGMVLIGLDLLEEIADRLGAIQAHLDNEVPTGLRQYEWSVPGEGPRDTVEVQDLMPWITAQIVNDGPGTVRIVTNQQLRAHPVQLKSGENLFVDFQRRKPGIWSLELSTVAGSTAAGRVFGKF